MAEQSQRTLRKLLDTYVEYLKAQGRGVRVNSPSRRPPARRRSARTLAGWARALVGDSIKGVQLKRIRSGVETLLAAQGVSREVRGHLQSHGLTGVQARHYDGHDYLPQKRHALAVLVRHVCECRAPGLSIDAPRERRTAVSLARNQGSQRMALAVSGRECLPG